MKIIKTSHDFPAIPDRRFDWSAVDDDTYDGPGCPIGRGATEQEAIDDLLEQLRERADAQGYYDSKGRWTT
jgi:hypothetical protein